MRSTPEQIVRIARIPTWALPLPIVDVIHGETRLAQIAREARWVVITHIPKDAEGEEAYVVYFVNGEGWPGDMDQYPTLAEAIEGIRYTYGVVPDSWTEMNELRDAPHGFAQIPVSILNRAK